MTEIFPIDDTLRRRCRQVSFVLLFKVFVRANALEK